jgi:threonine dehydrogenase-like Zn-dependent dehydrogenase
VERVNKGNLVAGGLFRPTAASVTPTSTTRAANGAPEPYPLVPGHEITGIITAAGADVTRHAVGDRVGVGRMVSSCRECASCRMGEEQYCLRSGVLDDAGQGTWRLRVRMVYGSVMVLSFRLGGGMGSRPRRAHSRLGGAAVLSGHG